MAISDLSSDVCSSDLDRAQSLMAGADQESRVRVDLTAVVIAVREDVPYVLTVERSVQPKFSLPSGPLEPGHHSLQSGLRSWVERQTHHPLGYVEQLYTFGDRATAQLDSTVTSQQRAISIAYQALVARPESPQQGDRKSTRLNSSH